jgi:hypothetical protein
MRNGKGAKADCGTSTGCNLFRTDRGAGWDLHCQRCEQSHANQPAAWTIDRLSLCSVMSYIGI